MKYADRIRLLSTARLNKYKTACDGDKAKTIQLYQYNIKLCQRFYGIMCTFEIILRNLINEHYTIKLGSDWIVLQAATGLLLEHDATEIHKLEKAYRNKGVYSHDKMVASFHFGFWTCLFTKRNYWAGGKTLLQIFPAKAHGLNQKQIYKDLSAIREFRNRIAHYEPICFDSSSSISTAYVRKHYDLIRTYILFMDYDPDSIFLGVEKPEKILTKIDNLLPTLSSASYTPEATSP